MKLKSRLGRLEQRLPASPPPADRRRERRWRAVARRFVALLQAAEPLLGELERELVAGAEREDLPALRAGIAYGPATTRAGDLYGNSVNLASRVTGIARPGSVLCTEEVRDAAADQFEWSSAGKHRLKGVSHSVSLYRARPLEAAAEAKKRPGDRRRKRAAR